MVATGLTSLLWFIAILVMIPLALWLLKRSPAGARFSGTATAGAMRCVALLPLSSTQRLVTVEVGHGEARRWLVLGVTASSITTLHTMDAQDASAAMAAMASPTAPVLPGFAQILSKLRQGVAR